MAALGELIVLLGPSGAGKSVQAKLLAARHNLVQFSSGQLIRDANDPAMVAQMNTGELIQSNYIDALMEQVLRRIPASQGVIVDGFPRKLEEVTWFDNNLERLGRRLRWVVNIRLDQQTAVERLMKRGRPDDNPESLAEKWTVFHQEVEPVLAEYRRRGLLVEVDGAGTRQEVTGRLEAALW